MLDKTYLCVAKIQTFAGGQPLTNATGFFFLHDEFLYLVTSRHVVISEAVQHRPDRLQVSLHSNERLDLNTAWYASLIPEMLTSPSANGTDIHRHHASIQ